VRVFEVAAPNFTVALDFVDAFGLCDARRKALSGIRSIGSFGPESSGSRSAQTGKSNRKWLSCPASFGEAAALAVFFR
jgi:hypothetical protein